MAPPKGSKRLERYSSSAAEEAVLSVLAGTPIEEAATRAHSSPRHLAEDVETYRRGGRAALDARSAAASEWQQINIEFVEYPTAQQAFHAYLLPPLRRAHVGGSVGAWWFVRKFPC